MPRNTLTADFRGCTRINFLLMAREVRQRSELSRMKQASLFLIRDYQR
jgi:hypothetical protein